MVVAKKSGQVGTLPPRIERLRNEFLKVKPSISIARAKATTEVARENPAMPIALVKAKGFYRACESIPIYIGKDELLVGHPGGKPRAGVFSPEIAWRWVEKELDTVARRPQDPYDLSEEDKDVLRREIFPFWKGRSVEEVVNSELDALGLSPLTVKSGIIDCEVKTTSGGGDLSPGYANILFAWGLRGVAADAAKRRASCDLRNPEDIDRIHFLRAVEITCDGMILLGQRYADLARAQAAAETSPQRKKELERIAQACERVPGDPPRNFHEALQAIWFGQVGLFLEENTSGTSPGRIDQYVFPFFERDLASGSLGKEEAHELLYCFLLKFNEIPWLLSEFATKYFAGYMPFLNICVGGQLPSGRDATNELSYLIMDCVKNLAMYQPSLAARVHNSSPPRFLLKVAELISTGIGFPALHFDDATIKMLISNGVSLEDARDYCLMGCVEPYVHGKMSRWTSACYTNFPVAIELALTNGLHRATGERLGLETGDPRSFKTYEEFEKAVKKQLDYLIGVAATATLIAQKAHRRHLPKPLSSALVEGCVESGQDVTSGGAHYNVGPGVIFVGIADYANSMAAVRKLVFDDRVMTMDTLCAALDRDFEGHDEVRNACENAPKYGNDIDYVDLLATDIMDYAAKKLNSHRGLFARLELGTLSVTTNVPQGLVIGALPSGRKAAMPLADGISPAAGTDMKGPTASIKSVDKLNQESSSVGTLFNMKLDPVLLSDDAGRANFMSLIRVHGQLGGAQIQFNCVDRETLLCAQRNPEQYRSLVVRVSGYSAFFTELSKEIQDDIINRTTQSRW
ncbi:MAG: formate C-acetyltransferase/glycerol dehydratase family glycyl radical enzyme [Deltaproteobacteria bacterium]|nr:formate C-acetyltransferase/glycerol dehydratase family glycyl radical enzyme [Deltaproteobacteria bacterium]